MALAASACGDDFGPPIPGYGQGEQAVDWTLRDDQQQPVDLHDFAGKVIFFEEGSGW